MGRAHHIEDYLEVIYFLANPIGEYGPVVTDGPVPAARVAEMLQVTPPTAGEMLKRLEKEGLIKRGARRGALLTDEGQELAEKVVRQHRIIERFLTDFLGYSPAESHVYADEMGDAFNDDMIERLSEQLGGPDRCPHGWPVDPAFEREENPSLQPLSTVPVGSRATVVRLAEHEGDLLHWFYDNGYPPTTELTVDRVDDAAEMLSVTVGDESRSISTHAASGLFVRVD